MISAVWYFIDFRSFHSLQLRPSGLPSLAAKPPTVGYGLQLIKSRYRWYNYNGNGDVVQTLNDYGEKMSSYEYDPYGVQKPPVISDSNPYRYSGEYYDSESGYTYLRARYYNPSIGRFISEDPALDGYNWYIYANGNPLMYQDPSGNFAITTAILLGAVFAGSFTASYIATSDYMYNTDKTATVQERLGQVNWGDAIATGAVVGMGVNSVGLLAQQAYQSLNYSLARVAASSNFKFNMPTLKGLNNGGYLRLGGGKSGGSNNYHGNSKLSTKPQHGYEIFDNKTGDVVKTGISGQKLNVNGASPRANAQVNSWNRAAGYNQYSARVTNVNIPGRATALGWEKTNALRLWNEGNSMSRHLRPTPWLD